MDVEQQIEQLNRKIDELERKLEETNRILETHQHAGNDGTDFLYNDPTKTKPGTTLNTGNLGFLGIDLPNGPNIDQKGIITVGDNSGSLTSLPKGAQLTIEHQPYTDSTTKQTFYYGFRSPAFGSDDGTIVEGGSDLSTNKSYFSENELSNSWILVYNPANVSEYNAFPISSNTSNTITISDTWNFSANANANFFIFTPIYFGAAQYPWRRLYTTDGSGGGIRFGFGNTGGGQNGLLYMDDAGDLYWRNKSGTLTKLN